jgi:predicted membrane protein
MGLLVVAIGMVLLLDQMHLVDQWKVFRFWPLLLVILGLRQLFGCSGWTGRMVGVFFILLGAVFQLENLGYDRIRFETVWPVFIIFGGVLLMVRSLGSRRRYFNLPDEIRDKLHDQQGGSALMDSRVNVVGIFGGGEYRIQSKNFQGGEATAIFGGFEIDLTQAEIEGEEAVIDITAIFGGGELRVPESWDVSIEGVGVFGGYEDKTHHARPEAGPPKKRLIVKGVAIFGGMEIKN